VSLEKYNPLDRILFHDDFDEGINGWCELVGNHGGDLDRIRPAVADLRPPQLSSATFFDIGTHGALDGTYSLKLATRPKAGHQAVAIKRLTSQARGLVQFETWFTFKAEQQIGEDLAGWDGNQDPSEANFGDITFSNDICEPGGGPRYMFALRYRNADADGNFVRKWLYKTSLHTTTKMAVSGREVPHADIHVRDPQDWKEIPGGEQPLCFNEVATKINWHYLRWLYDTKLRRNIELQVNDRTLNLRDIPVPFYDERYSGLPNLLNFLVDVRTVRPVRNFVFFDSIVVSADW
jgi:hypothetical protein